MASRPSPNMSRPAPAIPSPSLTLSPVDKPFLVKSSISKPSPTISPRPATAPSLPNALALSPIVFATSSPASAVPIVNFSPLSKPTLEDDSTTLPAESTAPLVAVTPNLYTTLPAFSPSADPFDATSNAPFASRLPAKKSLPPFANSANFAPGTTPSFSVF